MKKTTVLYLIDAIMLLQLALISGIGFLTRIVLVPGFKRLHSDWIYPSTEVIGLNRHQWNDIHFYLAILFLCTLMVHIILHFKSIYCFCNRWLQKSRKPKAIFYLFMVFILILIFWPMALRLIYP